MKKGCENKLCRRYRQQRLDRKYCVVCGVYWLRIGLTVSMRVVLNGEDLLMTAYVTYTMLCDLVLILCYQKKSLFLMLGAIAEIEQPAKMDFSYVSFLIHLT
jgi:hypothetical protein